MILSTFDQVRLLLRPIVLPDQLGVEQFGSLVLISTLLFLEVVALGKVGQFWTTNFLCRVAALPHPHTHILTIVRPALLVYPDLLLVKELLVRVVWVVVLVLGCEYLRQWIVLALKI